MAPVKRKTVGYLRVSTADQDLAKNKAAILQLANEKELGKVDFVEETVSGRVSWKQRKIAQVVAQHQRGDNVSDPGSTVWSTA